MGKLSLLTVLTTLGLFTACNTTTLEQHNPTRALGMLEVSFDSAGVSTARLNTPGNTRALTLKENNLVFGAGTTVVISPNEPYDYLVATFPVSHGVSSTLSLNNLTLFALTQTGSVGGTAIKTISNFGGVTNSAEQTRIAKFLIPTQAVQTSGVGISIDNSKADFQAFTSTEVSAATTTASSLLVAGDQLLNYGFSARCTTVCTSNSRAIAVGSTGSVSIALRVPKAASSTAYKFVMSFMVLDDSVAQVTRGLNPLESFSDFNTRAGLVGASVQKQIGYNAVGATTVPSIVPDVFTSKLNESIQALGIGRIDVGNSHSCGLTSTGTAYCWGFNNVGQLGNGTTTNSLVPVAVIAPSGGSVLTFSSITAGTYYSCGLTSIGTAYCWGYNGYGQLGNGTTTDSSVPVAVIAPSGGSVLTFSSITAGQYYLCGLTSIGTAYCWGNNTHGQRGNGTTIDSSVPVAVIAPSGGSVLTFSSITAGNSHSCGLTSTGTAYCWGFNNVGQLGNGTTADSVDPVAVIAPSGGSVLTFSSITTGINHSCGLTSTGTAYCWGNNFLGQLGNGTTTNSLVPVAVSAPSGGSVLTFSSITAGNYYSCGLTSTGTAYCWGNNTYGQLGNGTTIDSSVPVAVLVPSGGSVLTFSSITATYTHSCGLTNTGTAYCWGNNTYGGLGNGTSNDSSIPVAVDNTNYKP